MHGLPEQGYCVTGRIAFHRSLKGGSTALLFPHQAEISKKINEGRQGAVALSSHQYNRAIPLAMFAINFRGGRGKGVDGGGGGSRALSNEGYYHHPAQLLKPSPGNTISGDLLSYLFMKTSCYVIPVPPTAPHYPGSTLG